MCSEAWSQAKKARRALATWAGSPSFSGSEWSSFGKVRRLEYGGEFVQRVPEVRRTPGSREQENLGLDGDCWFSDMVVSLIPEPPSGIDSR